MHASQITYNHWEIDLPPHRVESNPDKVKQCKIAHPYIQGNSKYAFRLLCLLGIGGDATEDIATCQSSFLGSSPQ